MSRAWHQDLDPLDQGIIKMLTDDASLSNTALANALGVAKTTIGTRVKRLADRGIMQVLAETDVQAAGYELFATVAITVSGRPVAEVGHDLASIPEAIVVNSLLGRRQLMVHLIAQDFDHLLDLLERRVAATSGVREMRSAMSLRMLRHEPDWKVLVGGGSAVLDDRADRRLRVLQSTALADRVDELDLRIIAFLQEDGRLSLREIARQVGVSEGTVRARVKRLDQQKLLRRVAAVDPLALGYASVAYINLRVDPQSLSVGANAIAEIPEVGFLAIVMGDFQIQAVVTVRDRTALAQIINEQIGQLPGVRIHEVAEVVETHKQDLCWTLFVA